MKKIRGVRITDKTRFVMVKEYGYKDGVFQAGLVKGSPHPVNEIYLRINNQFFQLTRDEAYSTIGTLIEALWVSEIGKCNKKFWKPKWQTLKELLNETKKHIKVK